MEGHSDSSESSSDLEQFIDQLHDEQEAITAQMACAAAQVIERNRRETQHKGRIAGVQSFKRGVCSWFTDYLSDHPVYSAQKFRNTFRVPLKLFWFLHSELVKEDPKLAQLKDAVGTVGHSSYQKILSALRRLGSGLSYNQLDDISRMSPESQRQSFARFLRAVVRRFGDAFLNRQPSPEELRGITKEYEKAGFPGCIGCLYCMHMHWKKCPRALKGQYHNPKEGKLATISCEALCDSHLYCWHWFPGRCGTKNDITVLDNSPLMNDILAARRTMVLPEGYYVDGVQRSWLLYMLVDGVYPKWSIFVGPNAAPVKDRESYMTKRQESVRKDIERFFGCLQGRFKIMRQERYEWSDEELILISNVCVILHNMLVKMCLDGELADEYDDSGVLICQRELVEEFSEFQCTVDGTEGSEGSEGISG